MGRVFPVGRRPGLRYAPTVSQRSFTTEDLRRHGHTPADVRGRSRRSTHETWALPALASHRMRDGNCEFMGRAK
jgi:hypothetical protein